MCGLFGSLVGWRFFCLTTTCNTRAASVICFVHSFYLYTIKANGFYVNWSAGPKHTRFLSAELTQPHSDLPGANMQEEQTLKKRDFLCCSTLFGLSDPTTSTALGRKKDNVSNLKCWKSGSNWTVQNSVVVAQAGHTVLHAGIWVWWYSGSLKEYFNSFNNVTAFNNVTRYPLL